MIAIVDYGCGNLFSLSSSLAALSLDCKITGDAAEISAADHIILPGVGAFGDAADRLRESGLAPLLCRLAEEGRPFLGICLGMQLLFDRSFEYGEHKGLGLIHGSVVPFEGRISADMKTPHMGWNSLTFRNEDDYFLKYVQKDTYMYFVHSYLASDCEDSLVATADYGIAVPAIVRRNNVVGMQFHPEKSGDSGLALLRAFAEM